MRFSRAEQPPGAMDTPQRCMPKPSLRCPWLFCHFKESKMLELPVWHKVFDTQPCSPGASVAGLGKKRFLRFPPPTYAPYENRNCNHALMFASHCLKKKFKSKHDRKQMCSISQNRQYYTFAAKTSDGCKRAPSTTHSCSSCSCTLPSQAWASSCCGPFRSHLLVVHHIARGI